MPSPKFTFLVLTLLIATAQIAASKEDFLTYSEFISAIESGEILSVTLDHYSQISGTHTVDGTERPFRSYGTTGAANDILLTQLLKKKQIPTTLQERESESLFGGIGVISGLLMFGIPLATLIVVLRVNQKLNSIQHQTKL